MKLEIASTTPLLHVIQDYYGTRLPAPVMESPHTKSGVDAHRMVQDDQIVLMLRSLVVSCRMLNRDAR